MTRIIDPLEQFFDDAGDPLIDGLLYFYETGTNTPLDTFADVNLTLTSKNQNPLPLTASGRCPNAYGYNRLYRVVLKTSAGVQILQRDNVGSFAAEGAFSSWIPDKTYLKSEIATYNYKFYKSEVDGNKGNIPDSSSQWSEIKFIQEYQSGVTYTDEIVQNNGLIYRSLQVANIGHTPASSPNWWEPVGSIPYYADSRTYAQYDRVYVGSFVYISQQNGNLNHDPVADTAHTWWRPEWQTSPSLEANYLSGGGNLSAYRNNVLTDGSTYTLPLANSVPANTILVVSMLDTHKGFQPTVQRGGSDLIRRAAGTDTAMLMQQGQKVSFTLISNGVDEWRI